jgi:hypothetical protein
MGLKDDVGQLLQYSDAVAYRPPQTYLVATGAYTIFSVRNGAIFAYALLGRITAAAVGATTIATTLNGVAGDAGAVACNGAVGTLVWVPLNVGGTILNAAAFPFTVATAPMGMAVGTQPAGPGLIVITYAAGTSLTMEWSLIYKPLNPSVEVN